MTPTGVNYGVVDLKRGKTNSTPPGGLLPSILPCWGWGGEGEKAPGLCRALLCPRPWIPAAQAALPSLNMARSRPRASREPHPSAPKQAPKQRGLWECMAGRGPTGRSPEEMFLHAVMGQMGSQLKPEAGNRERSGSCFSKGMSHPWWDPHSSCSSFGCPDVGFGTACLGKESGWRGQKLGALKSWDVKKAGEGFLKEKPKR